MYRPILIAEPEMPVTVEEAIRQCRITIDAGDTVALAEVTDLLEAYIAAAWRLLNGWDGLLGRCVGAQEVRQDFDAFASCLPLPLGPVGDDIEIVWRNAAGDEDIVDPEEYRVKTDAAGRTAVHFRAGFSAPADMASEQSVSITYTAGEEDVPAPIKQAILLMVGAWYENREETVIGVSVSSLPNAVAVDRLIHPYRRTLV